MEDKIHIIGEIFSSGGATLYKNPSDQTVLFIRTSILFRAQESYHNASKDWRTPLQWSSQTFLLCTHESDLTIGLQNSTRKRREHFVIKQGL